MAVNRDNYTGDSRNGIDPRLDNPTLDEGGSVPKDATPVAEHGATVTKVYGTAMISAPLVVFQKQFNAIKGYKNWTLQDGWAQYDTIGFKTVLILGEAPIQGITKWWRDGSESFISDELCRLAGSFNRKVASGSTATVINLDSPLPAAMSGSGGRVDIGTNSRWIASSTTTSVTLTAALPSAPSVGASIIVTDGYTIQTSQTPGTPLPWLAGEAAEGMGFGGSSFFACQSLAANEDGKLPAIKFEVQGAWISGGTHAQPADVVLDLLTSERFGVGLSSSQIEVDLGPNGLASSGYRTYCASMGLLVSRAITDRTGAADLLGELLVCTNSVAVCTGGKVKIIPRGDTAIGDYVPPSTAAVLDDNEILRDGSNDPVTIRRTPDQDVFNCWPVTIQNRHADYEQAEYESEDTAHSAEFGQRRASATALPWVTEPGVALKISSLRAQRSIYVRNTYRFKVKPKWVVLEPMDYISLSHTVGGLSSVLCRIVTIRRLSDGALEIEAEEAPLGSATPIDLTPATQDGYGEVVPAPKYISDVAAGASAASAILTTYAIVLPTTLTGGNYVVSSYAGATTQIKMVIGTTDDSANWTVSKTDSNVTSTLSGQTVTITAMPDAVDSGYVDVTAVKGSLSFTLRCVVAKSKQGSTGATGTNGTNGASSTSYWVITSPAAVQKNAAGGYVQASVTASGYSATGSAAPAAYAGRFIIATSTNGITYADAYTSTVDEASLSYTLPIGILAVRVRLYLAGGVTTLLDETVIPVVADGATGATGLSAITVVVPNGAHTVPCNDAGTVATGGYAGSGTTIQVYEGSTALTFDTAIGSGKFTIGTPTVTPAGCITVGGRAGTGTATATVADHSAMVTGTTTQVVTITYPLTIQRANGSQVALSAVQTIAKSLAGAAGINGTAGARGAGWFYAASTAATATWDATLAAGALPGGTPVFQDRVTLYNNGAAVPWSKTWYYDGSAWQPATVVVDGGLLVDGSVGASSFSGNIIKTPNYTFSGAEGGASEVATAGAKMQSAPGGLALLAALDGVKFGANKFSELWSWGMYYGEGGTITNPASTAFRPFSDFTTITTHTSFARGVIQAGATTGSFKVTKAGNYALFYRATCSNSSDSTGTRFWKSAGTVDSAIMTPTVFVPHVASFPGHHFDMVMLPLALNDEVCVQSYVTQTTQTFTFGVLSWGIWRLPD